MKEQVQNLIKSVIEENAVQFKENASNVIYSKVADRLKNEYVNVSRSLFNNINEATTFVTTGQSEAPIEAGGGGRGTAPPPGSGGSGKVAPPKDRKGSDKPNKPNKPVDPPPEPEYEFYPEQPQRKDFDSEEAYQRALRQWETERKRIEARNKEEYIRYQKEWKEWVEYCRSIGIRPGRNIGIKPPPFGTTAPKWGKEDKPSSPPPPPKKPL